MPKTRVPHLKRKKEDGAPPPTLAEKLEVLVRRYQPKAAIQKQKQKKPTGPLSMLFRRAVTKNDTLRIYQLRQGGGGVLPQSFSQIARCMRMPVMTVWQAYKRFVANGNLFVDGNLRKGKYPHGKLVGSVKEFLLQRSTLQEWSGFSLEHRCHLLKRQRDVAVNPITLMRFYKRNGVKYYTLAYKYQ